MEEIFSYKIADPESRRSVEILIDVNGECLLLRRRWSASKTRGDFKSQTSDRHWQGCLEKRLTKEELNTLFSEVERLELLELEESIDPAKKRHSLYLKIEGKERRAHWHQEKRDKELTKLLKKLTGQKIS
jgi:hypothetical protein